MHCNKVCKGSGTKHVIYIMYSHTFLCNMQRKVLQLLLWI